MTTSEIDLHALLERVQKVEVQNRHWKLASLVTFVLLFASLTVGLAHGQQPQPNRPQTVEAQSFVLRDAGGAVRGQLSMKDNSPTLELYDKGGSVIWSTSPKARMVPAR